MYMRGIWANGYFWKYLIFLPPISGRQITIFAPHDFFRGLLPPVSPPVPAPMTEMVDEYE